MNRILHIIAIILFATLEISWAIWFGRAMPGLVLAAILALSLAGDLIDTIWWVGLGGLLLDLMTGVSVGYYLFIYSCLSGILIYINRQILDRPTPLLAWLIFLIASLLVQLLTNLIFGQLNWHIGLSALLTTALASLFYQIITTVGTRREVIHLA